MQQPLNQAIVKLWDYGHQVAVQVEARMRCSDHGEHQLADHFALPPNYVMNEAGLWFPHTLAQVADRFNPEC